MAPPAHTNKPVACRISEPRCRLANVTSAPSCGVLQSRFQSLPFCRIEAVQSQETFLFQSLMPQPLSIMFLCHIFSFLSLCAVAILAKPLRITAEKVPSPSVSANLIDAAFVSDVSISASALNTSAPNSMSIDCNGALYGFNPNIADCQGAAHTIVPDSDQIIWGERHTGLGDVFHLPFAVFGGKS